MNTKVALITGGSRGLGKAAAHSLAATGTDVIITYRSQRAEAEAVVRELTALGRKAAAIQLDVGKVNTFPEFVLNLKRTLQAFERPSIDYLLNNAGHGAYASIADTTEADFDELVNVHLKGVFFLTQKLLPLLADGGSILNLSSGLARFSLPGYAAYASMKGAIEVFTRYLAAELGPRRIRVNTLAPGAIETDFGGGAVRDNAQLNAQIAKQTALGRVGVPEDIGKVVAMLLSDGATWVNGQRIEAAGGIHL
jgi:NAD(P)-dependent dehydrogenase (short-subunit alcohol dehydrogenase family)